MYKANTEAPKPKVRDILSSDFFEDGRKRREEQLKKKEGEEEIAQKAAANIKLKKERRKKQLQKRLEVQPEEDGKFTLKQLSLASYGDLSKFEDNELQPLEFLINQESELDSDDDKLLNRLSREKQERRQIRNLSSLRKDNQNTMQKVQLIKRMERNPSVPKLNNKY